MLHTVVLLHPKPANFIRVCTFLSQFLISPAKHRFSTYSSIENPEGPVPSTPNQTQKDPSSLDFSGIANSVISKYSQLWNTKKGESLTNHSLKDYIYRLSCISPQITRSFWRVPGLKPSDVLEILLGFESYNGQYGIEVKKVESLWGIFKWASEQSREFEHLPQSCKIMASMLVRVGLFGEAEYVLSKRESRGILLDCQEIFSNLIEGYVAEFELDRAVSVYERMRGLSLGPSTSSYEALLRYLLELNETQLLYHVYMDMLKIGIGGSLEDTSIHENVIRLLCVDGKIQEARDLVRKIMNFGIKPSNLIVNAISSGYCEKKDYDDILSFLAEVKIAPDTIVGNKILFSLCRSFGVEEASIFMEKLEKLGFCPDEVTFGIFIGLSCREGNLRDAFIYVSDCLSRGHKPNLYSYNALLSGILKEGMWMQSRDLLVEMNDMGITPDLYTFKVLLAGLCKARQFDEVKAVIDQMSDQGLVKLSSTDDPVSKAFMMLGLDPSSVKIKRDNDKGFPKSEFFDSLGNGLYLDTDLDEYEKRISDILDGAMIPDFNSSILENCHSRDKHVILSLIDDMERWGQELSLPAMSSLLDRLSKTLFSVKIINRLSGLMSKSVYQLDQKSLNMLIRIYSKKGLTFRARSLPEGMARRGQIIENSTLSALLFEISKKKGDSRSLHYCCRLAQKFKWSPEVKDGKKILGYLCQNKLLTEALELLETMIFISPCNRLDIFHSFLGDLCFHGFTIVANALLEEFLSQTTILNHMAYSHLLRGFSQEKRFGDALRISDIMLSKNLVPPIDVSVDLIPQLCRTHKFEKAVELKDECLKEQSCALLPLHSALIKGLCKSRRVEEAESLFKDILSMSLTPDFEVLNLLIQCYCRSKNLKRVEELLGVMIRKNLAISSSSYSSTLGLLCSTQGKLSLAINFKELMLQVTELSELVLYNILISHFSAIKNISLVNAVIDEIQKKGLQFDEVTYNRVVLGFLLCDKDTSRCLQYLMTMIGKNLKPSGRSLRKVITCLCCDGKLDEALTLSGEMESRNWMHGSVIQNSIVEALLNKGKLHEAVAFLDRMEKKNLIPDKIQYDYLIKQFSKHHRLEKAVHLLNIMLKKGSAPESTSYDCIIQGFCNCKNLNLSLDFHTEMLYRGLKPRLVTWDVLVRSLCEEGRVAEAEKLLKSMIIQFDESPSREMFVYVIDKYRSESNVEKASEVLRLMQEKGYEPDFDTHWSVIRNLRDSNKKDEGDNRKGSFLSRLLSDIGFTRKNANSSVG